MKHIAIQTLCLLVLTLLGLITMANALPATTKSINTTAAYTYDLVQIVDRLNESE